MSKTVLLCVATSAALGLTTLHLVSELRNERATVQELQTRIAQLERAPAPSAMTAVPAAASDTAVPASPTQSVQSTGPVAAASSGRIAVSAFSRASVGAVNPPSSEEHERRLRESLERQRALLGNPQYRQAMITQHRMMLRQSHPDLTQELDLTAQEADKLFTLLAEQQLRGTEDVSLAAHDVQEMQTRFQQRQEANDAELRQLLGDTKLQAWKDYQSTLGVRHEVTQLRNALANRGVPLDGELTKPLLKAMADEQQRFFHESERRMIAANASGMAANASGRLALSPSTNLTTHLELQERHYDQAVQRYQRQRDALSGLLTAQQLEILEEEHNAQLQLQRAHLDMMRAQAEAEARGEVTPTIMGTANAIVAQ